MAGISSLRDNITGLFLFRKKASETRPCTVDLEGILTEGSTITGYDTSPISVKQNRVSSSSNVAISSTSYSGTKIQMLLSGGTVGETYIITALVTTTVTDEIAEAEFAVEVL